MDQQDQAKSYFDASAMDWQLKAEGQVNNYNVIEARNNAVLDIISRKSTVGKFFDVGCGTGQLAIQVAKIGIHSRGLDFSPEMIRVCEYNNKNEGAAAVFTCASFFDVGHPIGFYDVISAQGFIEYISLDQLDSFLKTCSEALSPGGVLALGSRNRIFNVFSLNAFTRMEIALGTLDRLVEEAICLQLTSSEEVFSRLAIYDRVLPQPVNHPDTGIGVDLRYQFSPAELILRSRRHSFVPHAIYPIHFHGLPGGFRAEHTQIHADLAAAAQKYATRDHRFVPYCSSFVLDLRRIP